MIYQYPDCRCCHEILIDVYYVARYSQVGKVTEVFLGFAARGSRDSRLLTYGKS